jgi:Na+/proline symporter
MTTAAWAILYLVFYMAATAYLSWAGARKTQSFASYAASGAQLGIVPTALVAAACLTSTATFSINPGYVYSQGISALIGFSLPVAVGVTLAFFFLGPRLRETSVGPDGTIKVLTLPQWIGTRFESPRLRNLFAVLVLALVSYAVLILVGASHVMAAIVGIPFWLASVLIMVFVVAYTAIGGTHAHASTNVIKGGLLCFAACTMGGLAAYKLWGGAHPAIAAVQAADPKLLSVFREGSKLFSGPLDVFVFPLVIGFALACQPHILVKALYVADPRAVRRVALIVGALFLTLGAPALLVGLAARADLGDALLKTQDKAVSTWIAAAFPAPLAGLLGVIMIAVAIGTLNALLLSLGSGFAHDVARPLVARFTGRASSDASALAWGRFGTVIVGIVVLAISCSEPRNVWVGSVVGVYALVAAACPAVVAGCLGAPRSPAAFVGVAAFVGPIVHLALFFSGVSGNPNATGSAGIVAALAIVTLGHVVASRRVAAKNAAAPVTETLVTV